MMRAFVPVVLLLASCSPPPPPSEAAQGSPPGAAMPKRIPGGPAGDPPRIFRAFGTEPFWSVNVEGTTLTYTTSEDPTGQVLQGERRAIENGVEITGMHAGTAFTLTVQAGDCNDGMSDNAYELFSTFRYGDIRYKGCGEAAK